MTSRGSTATSSSRLPSTLSRILETLSVLWRKRCTALLESNSLCLMIWIKNKGSVEKNYKTSILKPQREKLPRHLILFCKRIPRALAAVAGKVLSCRYSESSNKALIIIKFTRIIESMDKENSHSQSKCFWIDRIRWYPWWRSCSLDRRSSGWLWSWHSTGTSPPSLATPGPVGGANPDQHPFWKSTKN